MKLQHLTLLFTLFLNSQTIWAAQFSWFGLKLDLPFEKNWLVGANKRKSDKDPLVFFEPQSTPRIAATLYHTNYDLNPKDYSAFKETFLKSKMAWLKKQSADLVGEIVVKSPKVRGGTFSYEMTFKRLDGKFKEVGLFRRCKEKSFTLKAMLPEERWPSQNTKKILEFFASQDPCLEN